MTEESQGLEDVRRRLEEIQSRKRGGIRWNVSRHTAELAIVAIESAETGARQAPRSGTGKGRRRKRSKRLL